MRRAKQLEEAVRDYLDIKRIPYVRVDNYRCYKCGTIQNSAATGFPDFMIVKPLTAVEVKTGKGKLSPEQIIFKTLWEDQGLPYILVRDNIDSLMEEL